MIAKVFNITFSSFEELVRYIIYVKLPKRYRVTLMKIAEKGPDRLPKWHPYQCREATQVRLIKQYFYYLKKLWKEWDDVEEVLRQVFIEYRQRRLSESKFKSFVDFLFLPILPSKWWASYLGLSPGGVRSAVKNHLDELGAFFREYADDEKVIKCSESISMLQNIMFGCRDKHRMSFLRKEKSEPNSSKEKNR